MDTPFDRTKLLLGADGLRCLQQAKVAVFGLGGVGGAAAEALARAGVGHLVLIDHDVVSPSNLNRQVIATQATIGRKKVDVMKERIASIFPQTIVETHSLFYLKAEDFPLDSLDYIIDAIDTVTGKLALITAAYEQHIPLISSMGTGNKLHPELFEIADIYATSVCPLCRVMRRELKQRNIPRLRVVYSKEEPIKTGGPVPGSISFVPSAAGLILAGQVIRDLLKKK